MSVEELEQLIGTLNGEADDIKCAVNKLTSKVRTFPLGQDRFHRSVAPFTYLLSMIEVESVTFLTLIVCSTLCFSFRIFWKLPNVSAVLVESIESAGKSNSAVNVEETCSHDPPGVTGTAPYPQFTC